ncbi:MAG: helix-turn-helix domain-containing protein [Desulfovibrio sp.]|jgi:transcriptional regulator with XRE-family HTH domain|nr:helix-turn-helix domain-containing protein [Desulfovibrio sp.]
MKQITSNSTFQARLQEVTETLGMEHQAFARAGGVSKATFSNYMHGVKFPRMETIANWIEKFGINANWLISGYGSMFMEKDETREASVAISSGDPIVERMRTAVSILEKANAPDEVIHHAVLSVLNASNCPARAKADSR